MERLLFLCRRRPELDHDEYAEHLVQRHGPLALRHHPRLRRYVVDVVERGSPEHPEVDSVNSLWYDVLDDFLHHNHDSPAGERVIREDLRRFLGVVYGYATLEHVHRDADLGRRDGHRTRGAIKWWGAVRRHLDLDRETFLERWLGEHVPLMLAHQPPVRRLVSCAVTRKLTEQGDDWDLFYELHMDPEALRRGFYDGSEGRAAVVTSTEALTARRVTFVAQEWVQRWAAEPESGPG